MPSAGGGGASRLVLVHGLGGTIENWRALAPPLAARHRVLVPDLPGHGRSAPLPEARDVDALADAVLGIVDAEGVAAAPSGSATRSAAWSRSAPLCCRPDAVRGLVLAAAAGIGSATRLGRQR